MSEFVGADAEQVEALARRFDASSKKLSELLNRASIGIMVAEWTGADIDRLRSEWNRQAKPSVARSVAALNHIGSELKTQAAQQREASTVKAGSLVSNGALYGFVGVDDSSSGGIRNGPFSHTWGSSGFAGMEGSLGHGVDIGTGHLHADAYANGRIGAGGHAEFGADIDGVASATVYADGFVGAEGQGSVHYDVDETGTSVAGAEGSASAGVKGSVGAKTNFAGVTNDMSLEGFAGARAAGEASMTVGPDSFGARAGFDAFAGAEVKATQNLSWGGLNIGGSVSAYAGAGVSGGGGFIFSPEKVGFDLDLGFALGEGAGASINVSINPKEIGENLANFFGF